MSAGMSTFFYGASLVIAMGVVYGLRMTGWWISVFLVSGSWVAILVTQSADGWLLAVDGIAAILSLALLIRWTIRLRAWQDRMDRDQKEGQGVQLQLQGAVQNFRERIMRKAADVDWGLKQYDLIKRLAEAVSWSEMAPSLERAFKQFFKAEGWALYLTNSKGELELVQRRGGAPEPRAEDITRKEPFLHTFIPVVGTDQGRAVWALAMPLWRLHERIGHLVLRLPDMAAQDQKTIVAEAGSFSTQLIFAMAKARLYRELEQRSRTDGLTGLSRRGPFEERLKEEVARASAFRSTFSILMIDIDHFKRLNDTYGHQVGDEVLKTVSQRLREGLYETDVIARYGGEEFVCLMPRSDPAGLRMKADHLRQRIADQAFVVGLEAIQVTISLGIAHFPADGQSAESVLAAADRALYAAKHAGRNCLMEASAVRHE